MKVEQTDPKFAPVTVTLETREELVAVIKAFGMSSEDCLDAPYSALKECDRGYP